MAVSCGHLRQQLQHAYGGRITPPKRHTRLGWSNFAQMTLENDAALAPERRVPGPNPALQRHIQGAPRASPEADLITSLAPFLEENCRGDGAGSAGQPLALDAALVRPNSPPLRRSGQK